jgi:hypothetical protein
MKALVGFFVEHYGSVTEGVRGLFAKSSGTLSREEFLFALDSVDEKIKLTEE